MAKIRWTDKTQLRRVPGYTWYYISKSGDIYSTARGTLKQMSPQRCHKGYMRIGLYRDKKYKHHSIHRLVYTTWEGSIPKGLQINHKDGDKLNNSINNLEIVTCKENIKHGWSTNLYTRRNKKLTEKDVLNIRQEYEMKKTSHRSLGIKYNVSHRMIGDIINRKCWKHV